MIWCVIVALLALCQYIWFTMQVGRARGRTGIKAPAMVGAPELERAVRIHYNTLEQLVVFLPALLAAGYYFHAPTAACLGVIYLVGRGIFSRAYRRDPSTRALGFGLTFGAVMLLVAGGLGGAIWTLIDASL